MSLVVGAVILAAGRSMRYGRRANKLLLPFGETCVVCCAVRNVAEAGIARIVVVTGHEREQVQLALAPLQAPHPLLTFAHNPAYASGEMMSSVRIGVDALRLSGADAALIVMGDMPLIAPGVIRSVVTALANGACDIVAPQFEGKRGHPVLFRRALWPELLALPDDAHPRDVIARHPDRMCLVATESEGVLMDVDTPESYQQALGSLRAA